MAIKRFSEDYSRRDSVASCRFWLMLKMKGMGEYWDARYDRYLSELKTYLSSMSKDRELISREMQAIQISAGNTIAATYGK